MFEKVKTWYYGFSLPITVREAIAEFLGTYILVVIGNASIAQSQLTHGEKGDFFAINWGWALGCMLGILVSANVSGGHINPAVTLAFAVFKSFPWKKLPLYWFAQYLGALAASGTVLGIYHDAILRARVNGEFRIHLKNSTDPGTAAIFANYPAPYSTVSIGLADETVATMIFMLIICVVTDKSYTKIPKFMQPLYIGFTLLAMGIGYGANSGYALNPARDLAPRLVTYLGWWGPEVFSFRGYHWFWIFIIGPHIGAVLGIGLFHFLIKSNHDAKVKKLDLNEQRRDSTQFLVNYPDFRDRSVSLSSVTSTTNEGVRNWLSARHLKD